MAHLVDELPISKISMEYPGGTTVSAGQRIDRQDGRDNELEWYNATVEKGLPEGP